MYMDSVEGVQPSPIVTGESLTKLSVSVEKNAITTLGKRSQHYGIKHERMEQSISEE